MSDNIFSQIADSEIQNILHPAIKAGKDVSYPDGKGGYLVIDETPSFYKAFTLKYINRKKVTKKNCDLYSLSIFQKDDEKANFFCQCNKKTWIAYVGNTWASKNPTNLDYYYIFAVVNGNKFNKKLRTLRDINKNHYKLLSTMKHKVLQKTKRIYDLNEDDMSIYFHYLPSTYLLHVHFVSNKHPNMHAQRYREHSLKNVLANVQKQSNWYQTKNIPLQIFKDTYFYRVLKRLSTKKTFYGKWRRNTPKTLPYKRKTKIIINRKWRRNQPKTVNSINYLNDNWRDDNKDNDDNDDNIIKHHSNNYNSKQIIHSFNQFNLGDNLLRGLSDCGFEKPSSIQQRAILPIIQQYDTIIQSQSGNSSTVIYAIVALKRLDLSRIVCQILILIPTRELAKQIFNFISELGRYLNHGNIMHRLCIGGISIRNNVKELMKGYQIITGTPGRINHLLFKKILLIDSLKMFVLDESDEMLSKGFKDNIYQIFKYLPRHINKQIVLLSSTISSEIEALINMFMNNPVRILMNNMNDINQYYVAVKIENNKLSMLYDLYEDLNINKVIIYCNTKNKVMWLTNKMKEYDFIISSIHGDMTQIDREIILKQFRFCSTRVLISIDLLLRGIDICNVSLVINYDLPIKCERYIHRIGRYVINFVTDKQENRLNNIESFYNIKINELPQNIQSINI